jgi:AcrR family transcriptional regulator
MPSDVSTSWSSSDGRLGYGSIYKYFDSKEDLFQALMSAEEYALRTHPAVAMATTGARPKESWEPLRATVQATFEFFEADKAIANLVFRDA